MMSLIVQSCLMHEEAHVLSWREKYHIDGRCQTAQGDAESETWNQIFLLCNVVTCSVSALSLLQEYAELSNSVSHFVDELLLSREENTIKHEIGTMPEMVLHPSNSVAGRVSCLTACINA